MVDIFHSPAFAWDIALLKYINALNSPSMDVFMWVVSSNYFGVCVFVLLSLLVVALYRKSSWKVLAFIGLTVALTDMFSARVIKPLVRRPRPTHDIECVDPSALHLHRKDDGSYYYGGKYGFPSNHAANFMAMAIMFSFFMKGRMRAYRPAAAFLFLLAFLVGYSRCYLAVHYPSDILAGWLLASIISFVVLFVARRIGFVAYSEE